MRVRLHRWNGLVPAPTHGPQTWPWWRRVSFSLVQIKGVFAPSTGWRLWLYTRRGGRFVDLYFDRRERWW